MKNKQAFPINVAVGPAGDLYDSDSSQEPGMSLREYYAALAMQGVLSDSHIMDLIRCDAIQDVDTRDTAAFVAGLAVEYADALLEALE